MTKIPNLILGLLFISGTGVIVPMEADYLTIENPQVEECPCCHTKLSESQNDPLCTLECNHSYHTNCLKEYLDPSNDSDNQENTCLSCKKTISADFIRKKKLYKVGIINKSIECCICFDPTTDNNKACLLACSHETCVSCIKDHVNTQNNTRGIEPNCPECRTDIEIDFITKYIDPNFVRNSQQKEDHEEEAARLLQPVMVASREQQLPRRNELNRHHLISCAASICCVGLLWVGIYVILR